MKITAQVTAFAGSSKKQLDPISLAFRMLWRAYVYALDTKLDRWQYAIGLSEFVVAGVSVSELRWLINSGFACHAQEVFNSPAKLRCFVTLDKHVVPTDACFVLSDLGVQRLDKLASPSLKSQDAGQIAGQGVSFVPGDEAWFHPLKQLDPVPIFDPQRRELRFQDKLVKVFPNSASNQLLVVTAFHEEGWASRIDDPLPPAPQTDARRRLHDTIKQLNRRHLNPLLRFGGDGSGRGVVWLPLK